MKKLILIFSLFTFFFSLNSCKKENQNIWKVDIENKDQKVDITDISKEFFDPKISIETFKIKYPWFQGSVKDEDFVKRKNNPEEIKVYNEAASKIDLNKLSTDLSALFARVRHYFPQFKNPKVFTFSSSTQMYQEPIIFDPQQNYLFIDISGFMGEKNEFYKGIEEFFKTSMNPENIVPKISEAIAITLVPYDKESQKFMDLMVYNGKIMTLQDAFLPDFADHLKMHHSKKQYDWSVANEVNIWTFFVEEDLLFSPDPRLSERFIVIGPFSKFYTEVDRESSPQVGIFTGWQICRKFFNNKPETKLQDFLNMNATEIFNQSEYKPNN